jgi:hypothetical protein
MRLLRTTPRKKGSLFLSSVFISLKRKPLEDINALFKKKITAGNTVALETSQLISLKAFQYNFGDDTRDEEKRG